LFADANFPSNFLTTSSPRGLISPSEGSPTTFYLDMDPFGGISGMKLFESTPADRRVMFLAGVFLTDLSPAAQAPPSAGLQQHGDRPLVHDALAAPPADVLHR